MIQLDPKCSELVSSEIQGGFLYLDTNFLFRLFGLQSPEMFFASKELIRISKELKYKLLITPNTREEYLYALQDNLNHYRAVPPLPPEMLEMVIEQSDDEDPIVGYYQNTLEKGVISEGKIHIEPSVYFEYYSEIDTLLEQHQIEESNQNCEFIEANEDELNKEIGYLRRIVEDKQIELNIPLQELNEHVAMHDAFHRLLILNLRAGNDGGNFSDVPFWFLTCDSKLPLYDRTRRYSEKLKTPFCVLTGNWMQTIRPFVPRIEAGAVVGSINSPILRAYKPIPNEVIREVASRVSFHKGYNSLIGRLAMKRQFLIKYSNAESKEEKDELLQSVFLEYALKMEQDKKDAEKTLQDTEKARQEERALWDSEKDNWLRKMQKEKDESAELKIRIEEAKRERNNINEEMKDLKTQFNGLENQMKESKKVQQRFRSRVYTIFSVMIIFVLALYLIQTLLQGGLWWLIITGLLSISYILVTSILRPWKKGRWGKVFILGFPLLILASIALPLKQGNLLLTILGHISNFGGFISLALYLLFREE